MVLDICILVHKCHMSNFVKSSGKFKTLNNKRRICLFITFTTRHTNGQTNMVSLFLSKKVLFVELTHAVQTYRRKTEVISSTIRSRAKLPELYGFFLKPFFKQVRLACRQNDRS